MKRLAELASSLPLPSKPTPWNLRIVMRTVVHFATASTLRPCVLASVFFFFCFWPLPKRRVFVCPVFGVSCVRETVI